MNSLNVFENYLASLTKTSGNDKTSYKNLIKHWCYRQLLGLFPLKGEKNNSSFSLLDHWTEIKKHLILYGSCVTLELGEDIVVAPIKTIERNLSNRILEITIQLDDEDKTEKVLFTEIGKGRKQKELNEEKRKDLRDEKKIKTLEEQLIEGSRKFIFWQNNCDEMADMIYIQPLIDDLNDIHENMRWDRAKSRKKVIVSAPKRPSNAAWSASMNALENDYTCLIYPEEELPGNNFTAKVENPESQQKSLWEDHYKTLDFLILMLGITHNTNKKKERQNNPELELIESQFLTYQQEKRELLEKGIREWMEVFGGQYKLIPIETVENDEVKASELKKEERKQSNGK